jgi:hypothetical protein
MDKLYFSLKKTPMVKIRYHTGGYIFNTCLTDSGNETACLYTDPVPYYLGFLLREPSVTIGPQGGPQSVASS